MNGHFNSTKKMLGLLQKKIEEKFSIFFGSFEVLQPNSFDLKWMQYKTDRPNKSKQQQQKIREKEREKVWNKIGLDWIWLGFFCFVLFFQDRVWFYSTGLIYSVNLS